jgi:membrane associated rhomboid family serine protease
MTVGAIMGIYDREYYRDKTRGSGWLSGAAPACKTIIAINVVCYVLQKLFDNDLGRSNFELWLQGDSNAIFAWPPQIWRLLTATFLHDVRPWHILFNMLFLWMVGREMEAFYGKWNFVALYVSAAIFSSLVWAIFEHFTPASQRHPMIGASGAVMAVIVLYTMYYPRREILVFFILPVEMWLVLVIYLGYNLIQMFSPNHDMVAYSAHIGGAVYGYLYKVGDLRLSRFETIFRRRPRLRIVSGETRDSGPSTRSTIGPTWSSGTASSTRPSTTAVITEEQFDEKLDQILVKIAQQGRSSLTEEENRILDEASRRARNRRSERI